MTPNRITAVAVTPLALALAAVPAAPGQVPLRLDMYYNPAPALGDQEVIDVSFPSEYVATHNLTFFYVVGPPPCATPGACNGSFIPVPLGNGSFITYTAQPERLVSFYFRATRSGSPTIYSDMGQIDIRATNQELPQTPNPILFVTQVPFPDDFMTVVSSFGSHLGRVTSAPRGGDLYIRYTDGRLKNLTKAASKGHTGLQLASSIAVREPSVHWSGTKAVFSMIEGSQNECAGQNYFWQLWEVAGPGFLDPSPTAAVTMTKVPGQPSNYNNVSPCYASDGRILFTSDQPRNGASILYPQLDEYEEQPTNTGLWSLNPTTGALFLMQHSPSGSFKPSVDSSGRVIFTRWDHLERDQQKCLELMGQGNFQTFNYANETSQERTGHNLEVFPEPPEFFASFVNGNPGYSGDLNGWEPHMVGNTFNRFMPWMIRQNGTEEETLNHIGRHELSSFVPEAFRDAWEAPFPPVLVNHALPVFPNTTPDDPNILNNFSMRWGTSGQPGGLMQLRESASSTGSYLAVDARELESHACGGIVALTGGPGLNGDTMRLIPITHPDTRTPTLTPSANHSGLYRNPIQLTDGTLVSAHTPETRKDGDDGTSTPVGPPCNCTVSPRSRYDLRLKTLRPSGVYWTADRPLTAGIRKTIHYYNPNCLVTFSGALWELDPVEVVARTPPVQAPAPLATPEVQAINDAHLRLRDVRDYLRANDLALIVSRNLTTRDRNDRQQPFNLRVAGTSTQSIVDPPGPTPPGKVFDIKYLQIFQGDLIRGGDNLPDGRRVLAQPLHDTIALHEPNAGPSGSVVIADDGSMAALVPARRAMSWQITDVDGNPVVRERYWVSFQPGEIRTCVSCHGANTADQLNRPPPTNKPRALTDLLNYLRSIDEIDPSPGMPQQAPAPAPTPVSFPAP